MIRLTTQQLQTLRTAILADPALAAVPADPDGDITIANAFNALSSPAFIVWRTDVDGQTLENVIVWTEVISANNASAPAERDVLLFKLRSTTPINMALPGVRSLFTDSLSGSGRATSRNNVLAASKRTATRGEKLFATGTGTTADPAVMTVEGAIQPEEVAAARAN